MRGRIIQLPKLYIKDIVNPDTLITFSNYGGSHKKTLLTNYPFAKEHAIIENLPNRGAHCYSKSKE